MKTTGFKATVVLLVVMVMAGQAMAGWGGGGRRGGGPGRFRPGLEPGVQDNTDEQGPWFQRGPGRGGPDAEVRQSGPRRELRGPDAIPPRLRGQRMGRGWADGRGPGARIGRGGRAWRQGVGRGYQGRDICPYCQGTGRRPIAMQRRSMRNNWRQEFRGGRAGEGFRRGEGLQGRGPWNGPGQGLQDRNIGPRGQDYERRPMIRRGPWGDNRGQGPRSDGIGKGFPERDFGPQAQGPMIRRRPMEDNRGQGYRPGRGGRGFWRGDAAGPDEQGQGLTRPDRDDRPLPEQRRGGGREDRPRLRRGPGGPAVRPGPEEKVPDTKAPAETEPNSPVEDQPVSNES